MPDHRHADLAWLTAHCRAGKGIPRTALPRLQRVANRLARADYTGSLAVIAERTALLRLLVRSSGRTPVLVTLARHARRLPIATSLASIALQADLLVGTLAVYRGRWTRAARRHDAAVHGLRQVPVTHPDRWRLAAMLTHLDAGRRMPHGSRRGSS